MPNPLRRLAGRRRRRKDTDQKLAHLRDTVYQAPSLHDDPSYRERFLSELFSGSREPRVLSQADDVSDPDPVLADLAWLPPGHVGPSAGGYRPPVTEGVTGVTPSEASAPSTQDETASRRRRRRKSVVAAIAIVAVLAVSAHLLIQATEKPSPALPEHLGKIRVAYLPVVDVLPFLAAVDRGYFRDEGLEVKTHEVVSGPWAVRGIIQDDFDVAFSSYPGFFNAQIDNPGELKIINSAYTAVGQHLALMGPPNGSFTNIGQAPGKTIAVTSERSISDLGAIAQGVAGDSVTWVERPMPVMVRELVNGQIGGAVVAEPYVTLLKRKYQASLVVGINQGDTDDFPMSGWGVTARFARDNPKKVEAFQRAMKRAALEVQDINVRNSVMTAHFPEIDANLAPFVVMGKYPTSVSQDELQKVVRLMTAKNIISQPVDVVPMLVPEPPERK